MIYSQTFSNINSHKQRWNGSTSMIKTKKVHFSYHIGQYDALVITSGGKFNNFLWTVILAQELQTHINTSTNVSLQAM
jgi:hypothetical protein